MPAKSCHSRLFASTIGVLVLLVGAALAAPAQTFSLLTHFTGANGGNPDGTPIQGFDGNLYGTTSSNGGFGSGTVFLITTTGKLTTLYSFCSLSNCTDGARPFGALVQGLDGNLYGTTNAGGANQHGTVFRITPTGTLTTLYSFCAQPKCTDGSFPIAGLVQVPNGTLYGTTQFGGASNFGTIFKITLKGVLTRLYSFCHEANCPDGAFPVGLVQATDNNFYGVTSGFSNSTSIAGSVFRITPAGKFTILHTFCALTNCADGANPFAPLVQGTDGNFYGTTLQGGANTSCNSNLGCGTTFQITSAGTLTTLYSFCSQANCSDGSAPMGMVQATDGNFYGIASGGGLGVGVIFQFATGGTPATLHDFTQPYPPTAGLFQATNGILYGATLQGRVSTYLGYLYKLNMGLGAFVETLPTSGKTGDAVTILGTSLTGSTAVNFNGTPATFTVVSATEITAQVPSGATTGAVTVTTPSGTLSSNVAFRVP